MIREFFIFILFFVFATPAVAQGDVRFEATSDARQIILSGYFTTTFTIHNADGKDFTPPDFKDFTVISGPSVSTSMQIFNGQRSESRGYSYVLQPRKVGKFTIGAARITANGRTLYTKPFSIEVVKGSNSDATTREDLEDEMSEGVFIRAEVSNEEAFIGEQILLDYKLYTIRNIESYNLIAESEYSGFFAQDIRRFDSRVVKEVYEGKQFSTKILKRVSLFPQQAGKLTIDPLEMQLYINSESPNQRRSIFFLPKMTALNVNTDAAHINVKSLPPGKPVTFTGGVGKFRINANVNRSRMTTDDALLLRLEINGNGDVKQTQAPPLLISEKLEVYDPKIMEERVFEDDGAYRFRKVYEYTILPQEAGDYDLSVAFTYFDTDSLRYVTLNSNNFHVEVGKGVLEKRQSPRSTKGAVVAEDIRFIKRETNLTRASDSFLGSGLFLTLLLLPVLMLSGIVIQKKIADKRSRLDVLDLKRRQAKKVAQKRLSLAGKFLEQGASKAFYDEVSKALFGYICDKLNIPLADLTKDNVTEKLNSLQVHPENISLFMKTVQTCEMALFAGKDNAEAMNETYHAAFDVIAKIEEEIGG